MFCFAFICILFRLGFCLKGCFTIICMYIFLFLKKTLHHQPPTTGVFAAFCVLNSLQAALAVGGSRHKKCKCFCGFAKRIHKNEKVSKITVKATTKPIY